MSHTLAITPAPVLTWAHDVFGNAVATATFATMADMVVIDSVADILLNTAPWPVFDIAASAISYPFRYSDDEWTDLGALAIEQYSNQAGRLRIWARGFIRSNPTDTLSLLKDLSLGVAQRISYQSREVEGTQSPTQTLDRGWGSCRDFAVLFVEAARGLGFGARVVSGYLHNPNEDRAGSTGAGSTHAWVEVYVPGAGWITFDPTNRSVGGFNLIPVAVARDIRKSCRCPATSSARPMPFWGWGWRCLSRHRRGGKAIVRSSCGKRAIKRPGWVVGQFDCGGKSN